jgi:phospholipid/cholesterol/gamma-HCH transport system substrate-binding protein
VRWLSRLVSIVVLAALVVGGGLCIRSRMPESEVGEAFRTCALFRDGSKLATGSPVMIAGVRVGEVTGLLIDGDYARVEMTLVDETTIPVDSWVTKRAYSPFGDSYVEIVPTGPDQGAPTGRMLRSGQCLMRVAEGASTDRLLRSLSRTMPRVEDGLERIHEVGSYGRKWAAGTLEDRLIGAERWLAEERIERPLRAADLALERLEAGATRAAEAVAGAQPGLDNGLSRVDRGVAEARARIAELKADLREGMQNARRSLEQSGESTLDDFAEVMAAIDQGGSPGRRNDARGTLGHLIDDPELYESIEDATDQVYEGVRVFTRFKSWLGLRTEFNVFSRQPRFFVTAEIRARTDKFYLVELERGPLGDFPAGDITDTPGIPEYTRHQTISDRLRFTVQFGKTFGNWFQVRGGLKESTFGMGADMLLGTGRLRLSGDIYGGYTRTPRVKFTAALAVFRSAYLIAGIDDALTTPGYLNIRPDTPDVPVQFDRVRYGRDYFLGATLHFDDADLAVLLRVYGALLVGLL